MTTRKPGPSLLASLVTIAVGVVLAVPAVVVIGLRTVGTIGARSMATPGASERRLGSGTWYIFQLTGSSSGLGGFTYTHNGAPTLQPSDVTVSGPGGGGLQVSYVTDDETITRNGRIYTAVVRFDVPVSGSYRVQVDTPDSSVIVSRSLEYTFRGILGFIGVASVGGLVVAVGVVLLIVGVVRRGRIDRGQSGPPGWNAIPAGWYPDAGRGGQLRWWDGWRWSDHPT